MVTVPGGSSADGSKRGDSTSGSAVSVALPPVAAVPKSRPQPAQKRALLVRCRPHFGQKFTGMPYLLACQCANARTQYQILVICEVADNLAGI
jgi:hypothetical protein